MKNILITIFFVYANILLSNTSQVYRRPMPQLPFLQDPSIVNEIFDYSVLVQIHATLFTLNELNEPIPLIIKEFEPLNNGYLFSLKETTFHNGTPLEAKYVKMSLENAIKNKAINYTAFSKIKGFNDFISGKTNNLEGIKIISKMKFIFELTKPDFNLLKKLTDVRYSIWDLKDPSNGLGAYKVFSRSLNEMILKLAIDQVKTIYHIENLIPTFIIKKENSGNAIKKFKTGFYDDIFFYKPPIQDFNTLKEHYHIEKIFFPKTYFIALNVSNLRSINTRQEVYSMLGVKQILNNCFPNEKIAQSIVPPGFYGHGINYKFIPKHRDIKNIHLKIDIIESIGQEKCIKRNIIKHKFQKNKNIKIRTLSESIHRWTNKDSDILVGYLEGESTAHFLGDFKSDATYPISIKKKTLDKFDKLLQDFEEESHMIKKTIISNQLVNIVGSSYSFIPIFHPSVFLLYSKKIKKIHFNFQSAALIPFYKFRINEYENK
ncbi:MAG: hypothetical protein H6622_06860 [Halobacteriovoraceae bacterium]|nr:hypothetical protein [Halobacteriovoraceae bacterium]